MSFKVEKKVGANVYVYSVESVWDKEEKKVKKKYTYVGKKDKKSGNVTEKKPRSKPRHADDFGSRFFVNELIVKLKLDKLIKKNFPDYFEAILEIITFQVIEAKASYLMEYSFSDEEMAAKFSSQNLSIIFNKLGLAEDLIQNFFRDWIELHKKQDGLLYDITSFSSYNKHSEIVEWGYNRDKENLPQINFGLLYGTTSKLPLMYKIYPGSINDVSTLPNIHKELQSYSMNKFVFCFDRGFYSAKNMNIVAKGDYDVLLPMPFSTKEAANLANIDISAFDKMFNFEGKTTFCEVFPIKIEENDFFASVYLNERKRVNELDSFSKEMISAEKLLQNKVFSAQDNVNIELEKTIGKYSKYFRFNIIENKVFIERNSDEIKKLVNRMGKVVLITKNRPSDLEEIMSSYHKRDAVEKSFDILKNEMNENRLRVESTESIRGRLFINFLGLIINSHIINEMKQHKINKNMTVSEIIVELKKIRKVVLFDGSSYLTEISKTQRNIFEKFGIKPPNI